MYLLMKYNINQFGSYLLIMDDRDSHNYDGLESGMIHVIYKQTVQDKVNQQYKVGKVDRFRSESKIDEDENLEKLKERAILELL